MCEDELQPNENTHGNTTERAGFTKNEVEGTIEEALDATGMGRFHVWIIITAGLVMYTVNSEVWAISYVIPIADCDLNLSLKQKTILAAAGSSGIITTQYFWGYLSDKIGRRNVMLYSLIIGYICTIISAMVPQFWLIALFRFLNGTCIACASGVIFAYIGEFFSIRYRSLAIAIMSIFVGFGMTAIPLLAWLIIPNQWFGSNFASWRIFLLASGLPAVPACLLLYFSPESPKFLAQANRNETALEVLHKIQQINKIKHTKIIQKLIVENIDKIDIWELFKKKYLWNTFLVCILQAGVFGISGGLFLWYPDIQKKISKSTGNITACQAFNLQLNSNYTNKAVNSSDCRLTLDSAVYFQNTLIGIGFFVGYVLISGLLKYVGVKHILVPLLGLSGIATLILHFISAPTMIDALFLIILVISGMCIIVVNAAAVEIFPTNLRASAVCLTMLSGRIGIIFSSSVVGYLLRWNCESTFMIFAACFIACSIISMLLPISDKTKMQLQKGE